MPRIERLPPEVISRIAAGEVIERPANVFKELVENSLDAGAKRIVVDVGQGGLDYLRIVDDGCGIDCGDLALAFAPHATSKLRSSDDLFHVGTLGFRGEGLASIGGVAQVLLRSRTAEGDGAEIDCHGGNLGSVRPWGGPQGTSVEVRHLFYNIPARRKFLRGAATEMSHINEAFVRLALSQLHAGFTLTHNGRATHEIPASLGLLDRATLFFGEEVRTRLRSVEAEADGLTVGGYIADPLCERNSTGSQYLFVNGRWVRDRVVSAALQEAYRGLLMTGKHPLALLFLEVSAELVDVNVHPTKSEVRFRKPAQVAKLVTEAARRGLDRGTMRTPLQPPAAPIVSSPPFAGALSFDKDEVAMPLFGASSHESLQKEATPPPAVMRTPAGAIRTEVAGPAARVAPVEAVSTPLFAPTERNAAADGFVHKPEVRVVQMHDLYLVVEVPEGILILDQHALHERVLFEQLRERLGRGKIEVQRLLVPEPVSLSPVLAAGVLEHVADLEQLGLEITDFGAGTLLLTGYPALLGKRPPRDIVRAVAESLAQQDCPPTREALLNHLLSLIACHSAVRAGDRLPPALAAELASQHALTRDGHHCPHGRPSSLLFTKTDLDRQFRRV